MGYTGDRKREHDRQWMAARRKEWFDANGPCVQCGSWENLELDHIDPLTKITHNVWSWSEVRRLSELAKCQVLCHKCHVSKTTTNGEGYRFPKGDAHPNSKLTEKDVLEIRAMALQKIPYRVIAKQFDTSSGGISDIVNRKWWTHI